MLDFRGFFFLDEIAHVLHPTSVFLFEGFIYMKAYICGFKNQK